MSPRAALPFRIEFAILGLVRRQPVHGYELLQRWNEADGIGIIWLLKPAVLYAVLDKLEQSGYLGQQIQPGVNSPPRKVYHITDAGEEAFLAWMVKPVSAARDFRQVFLVKLYFQGDVEPALMQELLRGQVAACRRWAASMEVQRETSGAFHRQVLQFRIRQVKDILAWLEDLLAQPIPQTSGAKT